MLSDPLLRFLSRQAIPSFVSNVIVEKHTSGPSPLRYHPNLDAKGGETIQMLSDLYIRLREFMARKVQKDEEGQGMVEYALILVLIAIVVIVILQVVGKQVNNVFSNISNGLSQ